MLAALSGQISKPVRLTGLVAPSGRLAILRILATLSQPAVFLHTLYLEACLALWGFLVLLTGGVCSRLAGVHTRAKRLWTAFRLGAGVTMLCLQPWFAELLESAEGWAELNVVAGVLFMQVAMPDSADSRQEWAAIMDTPLYSDERPVRAVIYRRVSTLEQEEDGHSLDEQLVRAERYIKEQGWKLVEVYTEVQSGKSGKRPELRRLKKAVQAGEVDVVVIDRIDRFYRNLLGLLRTVQLFDNHGTRLVSVSERIGFDTPWGRLVLNVLGALAEYYLVALSADTRKGKHARARSGLANGAYRLGYCKGHCGECSDPNGKNYCPNYGGDDLNHSRVLILHPVESQAVQLAYRLYGSGEMSDEDVAHRLNASECTLPDGRRVPFRTKGLPGVSEPGPFTKDAVRYVLTNPYYKGLVGYGGVKADGTKERKPVELFKGRHEPLVDEELWTRCQRIRAQRRYRSQNMAKSARVYPLSKMLFCNQCGEPLRGFASNQGRSRYYGDRLFREKWRRDRTAGVSESALESNRGLAYDHQPNVRAEELEAQVDAVVSQIELPLEWKRLILAYLSDDGGLSAIQNKKLAVRDRLQRANERYTSPIAPISRREMARIEGECMAELARIDSLLPPGMAEPQVWPYLDDFGKLWAAATWEEQNQLLDLLCSGIFVQDQDVVKLVAYPAFHDLLLDAGQQTDLAEDE